MEADHEGRVALAWHTEGFAREKRLKPLRSYLQPDRRTHREADLLAALKRAKKKGAKITITKVER